MHLIRIKGSLPYRAFSLTWRAAMQIYWDKRKRLHKKRVQLPKDFLATPTWPPFHWFRTPIWPHALYRLEGNHGGMQRGNLWSRATHLHELFLTSSLKLRANGRSNSHRWELLANNVPSVCTGLKVWPVSNFAQQLPTTRSNMQQGVHTDATCNIQQCWELLANNGVHGA